MPAAVDREIEVVVEQGDVIQVVSDVLALKHAQTLVGADAAVVARLEAGGVRVRDRLPSSGAFTLVPSSNVLRARSVLFIGVKPLGSFDYAGIREFGRRALEALVHEAPQTEGVTMTLHGPGYGLDEAEAFRAELAGLLDAMEGGRIPRSLRRVTFVELDARRAERMRSLLEGLLPSGSYAPNARSAAGGGLAPHLDTLRSAGIASEQKPHAFVAMPFAAEFEDHFHYGIQAAVSSVGLLCERADLASFTGDVMTWVKARIASAQLLIADLSLKNPNVYLEVGYAWGCGIPTVLLVRDAADLLFDVRGQRCLVYNNSIKKLEALLRQELGRLGADAGRPVR